VVSSGLIVQTIASTINGIEINPIICSKMYNCGLASSGALKTHGNGSDMTNQIVAKSIIV
jgi:hypothetical protein